VNHLATQKSPKRLVIRWATLKGLVAIILFIVIAALIEYSIVLYAMNIGVQEKQENLLQWSFLFPGTDWTIKIMISPLFHLIPVAVIIALLFSWIYLTRHIAIKPYDTRKEKVGPVAKKGKEHKMKKFFGKISSGLLKIKGFAYVWQRIHFARATIKSALTIFLVFSAFVIIFSLLAYPNLIYQRISSAYQNNSSLLDFVKGTEKTLAPIFGMFSAIGSALVSVALGFRSIVLGVGILLKPLADLDSAGKYLAFQNLAAWISAFAILFYGEYVRKSYRYKRVRKS